MMVNWLNLIFPIFRRLCLPSKAFGLKTPVVYWLASKSNINTNPDLMELETQQKYILKDLISMVTSSTLVASDIAKMMSDLNLYLSEKLQCKIKEGSLKVKDIKYLLQARRENLNRGNFNLIYPSSSSGKYSQLMDQLQSIIDEGTSADKDYTLGSQPHLHRTSYLHSTLLAIAKYFTNTDNIGDSYDDLNLPVMLQSSKDQANLIEHIHDLEHNKPDLYYRRHCSNSLKTKSNLQNFQTNPKLKFTPDFHPSITKYYTSVPYEVILVQVWAFAESCLCEARLGDKYGLSRPSNYTVGLGNNTIHIHIVDTTHTDPWILKTYTLYMERKHPSDENTIHNKTVTVACTLLQDCGLKYIPGLTCGIQNSSFPSWDMFQIYRSNLEHCTSGDQPGQWVIPCQSCSLSHTCDMNSAVWQPYHCTHPTLPRPQLKQCMAGKQILFIGDSTNRGMMHYLMEQVNGTLTEWDKTHDIKVYSNINNERTALSFAYYPQFWLPANQRPVFDKALYQLMKESMPLENNHNTVVVVGGVHWLATHHLTVLINALKREGLSEVKVIMKGLGAGFHQCVDGLHCLSVREQRKLLLHNHNLLSLAKSHGFKVVDTFNITMARYKDFLQGQCACHFHRVEEILSSVSKSPKKSIQATEEKQQTSMSALHYHIEGNINKIYSEILINTICDY